MRGGGRDFSKFSKRSTFHLCGAGRWPIMDGLDVSAMLVVKWVVSHG